MLKLVKFSRLKNNSGFTWSSASSRLYVKCGDKKCSYRGVVGLAIGKSEKVWADDSRIKPWWKLW